MVSLLFGSFIIKYIHSIEGWFKINMAFSLGVIILLSLCWIGKGIYVKDFRELDKEPQFVKVILLCASLVFGVIGTILFVKSGFWVRAEMIKYFH